MTKSEFVDVDGHIQEPADLWEEYLEPEYKERALRIELDEDGLEYLSVDGEQSWFQRNGPWGLLGQ